MIGLGSDRKINNYPYHEIHSLPDLAHWSRPILISCYHYLIELFKTTLKYLSRHSGRSHRYYVVVLSLSQRAFDFIFWNTWTGTLVSWLPGSPKAVNWSCKIKKNLSFEPSLGLGVETWWLYLYNNYHQLVLHDKKNFSLQRLSTEQFWGMKVCSFFSPNNELESFIFLQEKI